MNRAVTTLTAGAFMLSTLITPLGAMAQTTNSTSTNTLYVQVLARQLRQGLSGEDVKLLQTLLAAETDIYPEGLVTGYFGPKTAAAVKKFQKKNNLPQVGRVGPQTLKLLRDYAMNAGINQEDDDDDNDGDGNKTEKKWCVVVPPGHLIAPGWLKKNNNQRPIIPECQKNHPGTINKIDKFASTTPGKPDTIAPVISNVASTTAITTATITWNTNEFATSLVWYSSSTPFAYSYSNGSNTTTMNHSVGLASLNASTTYSFVIVSKDASGNIATSSMYQFTTK